MTRVPHPIPYQGSKRRLAPAILAFVPPGTRRLVEPCAGSAALSLAALASGRVDRVLLGDAYAPLAALLVAIAERPEALARGYARLWRAGAKAPVATYAAARDRFNARPDPARLLYLLARCVKAAVRFNAAGAFNQSADRRRLGARPERMAAEIRAASALLARATITSGDYERLLARATPRDVVYLDPPWEGTSRARDRRYALGLDRARFVAALARLADRGVPVIVSLDGRTGDRRYAEPLPRSLGLMHLELDAGPSSQATLSGRHASTFESLYVSPELARRRATPRPAIEHPV